MVYEVHWRDYWFNLAAKEMNIIYKYKIEYGQKCIIEMPDQAQILSLQVQNDIPCIWVLVDPNKPLVKRTFVTYVTGSIPNPNHTFIGTYQIDWFVGHVFEKKE